MLTFIAILECINVQILNYLSSTGIWNLEDLGPSDLCFIVCSSFEHSCCHSRTMTYLITIYVVFFCIYLTNEVFFFCGIVGYSNKIGNTTPIIHSWSRHQIVNNRQQCCEICTNL